MERIFFFIKFSILFLKRRVLEVSKLYQSTKRYEIELNWYVDIMINTILSKNTFLTLCTLLSSVTRHQFLSQKLLC
mgnify:CR=1 FL=1